MKEFWLAGACHSKQKKSHNNKGITGGVSSSTLGILNFTSAFILLGAGTGLATLTLLMEYAFVWFGRRHLSAWDKKGCCTLVSMVSLLFLHTCPSLSSLHIRHHGQFVIAAYTSAWSVCHCCTHVNMVSLSLLHARHRSQFVIATHTSAWSVSFSAHSSAWSMFHCCTNVTIDGLLLLHTHQHGQFRGRGLQIEKDSLKCVNVY